MACDDIIACGTLGEHDIPLNPLQSHMSLQSPSPSREDKMTSEQHSKMTYYFVPGISGQ